MSAQPTVSDHLRAFGETPAWVVTLGEAIHDITGCSAAIAAARARDLSRQPRVAQGLEAVLQGWSCLEHVTLAELSPMQLETVRIVVSHMLESMNTHISTGEGASSAREEMPA